MPKILHIGGVDSPHVVGIMEQVKQLTSFDQTVISYPATIKKFDIDFLRGIKGHYYNYPIFFSNKEILRAEEQKLAKFIHNVIDKEKPDIIHGHYLSKCAVPMYYAMKYSGKPGVVASWSVWDIPKTKIMFQRIQRCLNLCTYVSGAYVVSNPPSFLDDLLKAFGVPNDKALHVGPPVRLHFYTNHTPNTDVPRIYIPRKYFQDVIFKALPKILKQYPNAVVTALSADAEILLAKQLGIYNKITFLPAMLSQVEFSEMIKRHNIIFSIASDPGISGTTMQAAYFGAITMVNNTTLAKGILEDGKHALACDVSIDAIEKKLVYAIENLSELCLRFKENNKFLAAYGSDVTGKRLIDAYHTMLHVGTHA